jgi:hypothetical protein
VGFLIKRTETDTTAFIEDSPTDPVDPKADPQDSTPCLSKHTELGDIVVEINKTNNG